MNKKNKFQGCELGTAVPAAACDCDTSYMSKYEFDGNHVYMDGKYFGKIIGKQGNVIQVEYKGDNMYMQGHISTIHLVQ